MSADAPGVLTPPLAHLGHWAALLYAAPALILVAWAGVARLRRWIGSRRPRNRG